MDNPATRRRWSDLVGFLGVVLLAILAPALSMLLSVFAPAGLGTAVGAVLFAAVYAGLVRFWPLPLRIPAGAPTQLGRMSGRYWGRIEGTVVWFGQADYEELVARAIPEVPAYSLDGASLSGPSGFRRERLRAFVGAVFLSIAPYFLLTWLYTELAGGSTFQALAVSVLMLGVFRTAEILLTAAALFLYAVWARGWASRDVVLEGRTLRAAHGTFHLSGDWTYSLHPVALGMELRLVGPGRRLVLRGDYPQLAWLARHLETLSTEGTPTEVPEALRSITAFSRSPERPVDAN